MKGIYMGTHANTWVQIWVWVQERTASSLLLIIAGYGCLGHTNWKRQIRRLYSYELWLIDWFVVDAMRWFNLALVYALDVLGGIFTEPKTVLPPNIPVHPCSRMSQNCVPWPWIHTSPWCWKPACCMRTPIRAICCARPTAACASWTGAWSLDWTPAFAPGGPDSAVSVCEENIQHCLRIVRWLYHDTSQ